MLSLSLFGSATLSGEDGPVRGRAAHKRRLAVLAVLAGARFRPIGRERLVSLIWPDMAAGDARRNLSEALYVLRKDVADDLFVSTGDEVGLNSALIRCDVAEFEEAVEAGEPERAVALYHGPFLEGFYVSDAADFQRWAEEERLRLERVYDQALEQMAEKCEKGGDPRGAVAWWRKLAVRDPYSSRVTIRLMLALEAAGDHAAAIQHAKVHITLLREDLGAEPDPEVLVLLERLKTKPTPTPVEEPPAATPPPVEPPTTDSTTPTIPSTTSTTPAEPAEAGAKSGQTPSLTPPASERVDTPPATVTDEERAVVGPAPEWDGEVREETQPANPSTTVVTAPVEEPAGPETLPRPARTTTVWRADVAGFLELMGGRQEVGTLLLEVLSNTARLVVSGAGGHLVEPLRKEEAEEEGVVAEFDDTRAAVRAASQLVQEFQKRIRKAGIPATLQVGVHRGGLSTTDDGSVYGEAVSGATQAERLAEPGQVLATAEVRERLRNAPEMRFAERGTIQLPGRDVPTEVFDVQVERRAAPIPSLTHHDDDRPRRRVRREWAAAAAAGVIVLVLLGMLLRAKQPSVAQSPRAPLPLNRIAVLYLEDHSQDGSLGHIAGGFTDQLIDQLARVEALDVVPRSGVRPFRNSLLPPDSVARLLGAGTFIEGGLQQADGKIRLTIRVFDASRRTRLRSKTLERPVGQVFALQDDLAEDVARFLRGRLGEAVVVERRNGETRSAEAKHLVFMAEERRKDADTITTTSSHAADSPSALRLLALADTLLERAAKLDPRWTEPPILRAWIAMERFERVGAAEKATMARLGIRYANQALKLRPNNPRALEVRGISEWRLALRTAETNPSADTLVAAAERDLGAATQADSLRAPAWNILSVMLRMRGEFAAADVAAQHAIEADAYLESEDKTLLRLFHSALDLGEYARARQHCEEGHKRFADQIGFVQCRLTLMVLDPSERPSPGAAWEIAARLDSMDSPEKGPAEGRSYWPVYRELMVAAVLARAGARDSARAMLARARAKVAPDTDMLGDSQRDVAQVWIALAQPDSAVAAAGLYLQANPLVRGHMARDPAFMPLRSLPEFARITTRPARPARRPGRSR